MRSTFHVLGLAVLLALTTAVGCGKKDETLETPAATSPPASTAATPPGPSGPSAAAPSAPGGMSAPTANPTTNRGPEAMLSLKIKNALMTSKKVEMKGVTVAAAAGTVTLKGTVPNAQMKTSAEFIAKQAAGSQVKVVNEIEVKGG